MTAGRFSIITPAFKQTDWLRLCVLSVADQALDEKAALTAADQRPGLQKLKIVNADIFEEELGHRSEGRDQSSDADAQVSGFRFQVSQSPLEVEHIIQDAGSPGFEIFAREVRAGSDARRSDVGDQR